ncbi:hypothetical protein [Halioxenophilus aromaticivorans]|uniref:Acyltransferase n=1 Tax=Halioxenophilus aromaticivorans TaxID=1306992 RepID=A0AAV3TZ94_9ALTE
MNGDTVTNNKASADALHWSSMREAGTLTGLRFLWAVHRYFGRPAVSFLLRPIVWYFVLFRAQARRGSLEFLTTHWQCYPELWKKKPGLSASLRHFREFAETVVDKLMAWHLELDPNLFYIRDKETHRRLLNDTRGQLIIGSHLGNIEYCRGFMQRYKSQTINVLLHDRHAQNYVAMMQSMNPQSRVNVFQVDEFDITTILQFKDKIDAGEWVFIAGDRTPPSGNTRTVAVTFMGRTAHLPIGPYLLARALECPVKLMFAYRNYCGDDNRLYFDVVDFADQIKLPAKRRQQLLQDYAQQYANHLEKVCREAPYQWFNFYSYWADSPHSNTPGDH